MLLVQKLPTKSRALQDVFSNANEKPSTSKNNLENDSGDEEDWDSSSNAHEDENNDHSFIGEGDEDDNNVMAVVKNMSTITITRSSMATVAVIIASLW